MRIKYRSNNSGGSWWLNDKDWSELERAGWKVHWRKDDDPGRIFKADKNGRWLGALATTAEKDFETPAEAMKEFEKITGLDVTDEGCNCCGPPHEFTWDGNGTYGYASGEACLTHLFGEGVPKTLREAIEKSPGGKS